MTQFGLNDQDVGLGPQMVEVSTEWERVIAPTRTGLLHFPRRKHHLTILLIGETGSGKTAFMSLLLNLFQGNGPFDLKDKHFAEDLTGLDQSQSQTTAARVYSFTTADGAKIEILDTPGLADTRGMEEDNRHKDRILNAIQDLIKGIDAVMIVANGTVPRLTVSTSYTLNIVSTLFPRSIVNNIGFIFTNTMAGGGLNFQMRSLPPELRTAKYWCLNNPLPLCKNYIAQQMASGTPDFDERKQRRQLGFCYDDAIETLDQWLGWVDERKEIPTTTIIELYQKSSNIESRLFAAIASIDNLSKLESQLVSISSNLQTSVQKKDSMATLQQELPAKIWVLEETAKHNTICTISDCHSNCHEGCSMEVGDAEAIGAWCKAFKTLQIANQCLPFWGNAEVKCGRAECGHEAREHRCYKKAHKQIDNESYQRIVENLQTATTETDRLEMTKAQIGEEIEAVKRDIEQSKCEIPKLIVELNDLSLSPNYAGYISSALHVLEMRREQLMSRHGMENELDMIIGGIKAFEAQLKLLRDNEDGRVVEAFAENPES